MNSDSSKTTATSQEPLFSKFIAEFTEAVNVNTQLTQRAYNKSIRIAGTGKPIDELADKKEPQSIIDNLNNVLEQLKKNTALLQAVVYDLDNSIP